MDNVCLHRGGPLGQGTIENGKVGLPLARLDLGSHDRAKPLTVPAQKSRFIP